MEIVSGSNLSLKTIFKSPAWSEFKDKYCDLIRPSVLENVNKIMDCGTEALGYSTLGCECGYRKKVPFTCKSRFCSSCGKVACDNWINSVINWSLPDMHYHHVVFTLPQQLRTFWIRHRKDGLNILFKASTESLLKIFSDKWGAVPGIITVIHTFGSDIKWNPHVHTIITGGGLSSNHTHWNRVMSIIPYRLLNHTWRYHVITLLRNWAKQNYSNSEYHQFNRLLDKLYRKNWYINVGKKLTSLTFTIGYVGRYAKRPVLAEARLINFDGQTVTFSFKDKRLKKRKLLALPVLDFIGTLIRHIPDKHFRMIRYSGIFANRVKTKLLLIVQNLITTGTQRLVYLGTKLTNWRDRIQHLTRIDPYQCPQCSRIMEIVNVFIRGKDGYLYPAYLKT